MATSDETDGMDVWLDNLETLGHALSQRRMTGDQLERFARLLDRMQRDALERGLHHEDGTYTRAARTKRAPWSSYDAGRRRRMGTGVDDHRPGDRR